MEIDGTWYTTAQAADALGISHDTVRSAVRLGTLAVTRINPRLNLISAEAIEHYRRDHLGKRGRPPRRHLDGGPAGEQTGAGEQEASR